MLTFFHEDVIIVFYMEVEAVPTVSNKLPNLEMEWRFRIPDDSEYPYALALYGVVNGEEIGAGKPYRTKQDLIDDLQGLIGRIEKNL
jgi:hypothetical protein